MRILVGFVFLETYPQFRGGCSLIPCKVLHAWLMYCFSAVGRVVRN